MIVAPETSLEHRPVFVLIDGHSLAFRSYFAYSKGRDGGLRTSTGIPTSVCFGFLKAMLEMIGRENPQYVAIAFDLGLPTFRHEADETYKDGRPDTPEDFIPDIQNLQKLLAACNLPVLTAPGYEADDVIGTLARRASTAGYRVKILSGDQDLFQLVDPDQGVTVLHLGSAYARRGDDTSREFGPQEVQAKLGILPSQVVDYKALCGDTSDNIPGVRGIGPKTAVQLLTTYGSLEAIYNSLEEIKGATRKKLEEGREAALHSQYLAQIALNVPLDVALEDCKLRGFNQTALMPLLEELELKSFVRQVSKIQVALGGEAIAPEATPTPTSAPAAPLPEYSDDSVDFFSAEETEAAQAMPSVVIEPQIVDTPEKLAALVAELRRHTDPAAPVAWDTETTALDPLKAELVGIGCCWGSGKSDVAYIPLRHKVGTTLPTATVLDALRPILEDPAYPKALQNTKFDRLVLRHQGVRLQGVVFDTMLASYVLNPDDRHNLGDLSVRHLSIQPLSYSDLVPKGKSIEDLDIAVVADYCGMDAYGVYCLVPILAQALAQEPRLLALFQSVEVPLEPVLAEMEFCGIRIDPAYLQNFSAQLEQDLQAIEARAYASAGETFNLGSPKQLSELLFDKLGLSVKKSRKTKTGYSTDAAVLEKLQGDHPVVDAIVEYRSLAKLKSTYVDALPLLADEHQRIHTDFNQAITATGRLSSSNPNLQNIPIRTAFSRQIRKAFLPQEGWQLAAADYSQIELRILAHLSEEPVLLETYRNNEDVHALTARLLLEKEAITPEERRLGKVINFGVIYGMGAQRFARETGVSSKDAKVFIERFNERYPRVFAYLRRMEQEAIARGYVETILGRRRYFQFESSELKALRDRDPDTIDLESLKLGRNDAGLLRAAANAPIQGSSADIIKRAMVKLAEVMQPYQARLLLQVHDELVFEVPPEEWDALAPQIRQTMESAVELKVPLVAEVHAGQNWMETK
ncbi:DNA polymerase I [Geitlerinema sp. PCC 7407]|uniref:DNA polymerase I n=1 Tax=Geitlerinema sp. PCC 7407 TaxID=1173025 RepID=UPI001CBF501A|nr:DNA polymerase I [Geitlerinema sp. PCC 7407]